MKNPNYFYKKNLGSEGEKKIGEYLEKNEYKILEYNYIYKNNYGEIDIIAIKKDVIVFVEVKTRTNDNFAKVQELVNNKKRNSIIKTAKYYLLNNNLNTNSYLIRFDIAYINNNDIEYYENAFTEA